MKGHSHYVALDSPSIAGSSKGTYLDIGANIVS